MEVIIEDSRTAFLALFKMQSVGDGEPAYGSQFAIDPKSANVKKLDDAIAAVAKEKWKDKADAILATLIEDKRVCFTHGPSKNKDGVPYEGFEGMYSLRTRSSKIKPTAKDRFNKDVTEADGVIYNGCYVHAAIDIWAQDNQYGRRINATLQGVMFSRDGAAFGGGRAASDSTFANLAAAPTTEDFV